MMKVLLITFSNHYTFQETIYGIKNHYSSDKYCVYTIGSDKVQYSINLDTFCQLFSVPSKPGLSLGMLKVFSLFRIVLAISKIKPNRVVFISSHIWNIPLIIFLRLKKRRVIHIMHDVIPHEGEKNSKPNEFYNKIISKFCDLILVHSEMFIDLVSKKYKISKNRIKYVGLTRDYNEDFNMIEKTNTCLFFGRINKYKGLENVHLLAKMNSQIHFVIAGKPEESVVIEVEKIRNLPNVTVIDEMIDETKMRELFLFAEIIILPYISATQSGVIVDAYRFSRPVIAYNVGAFSEQIIENLTGYIIPPRSIVHFSEKLNQFFSLPLEVKNQIAYSSWTFGCEKYGTKNNADSFLESIV